MQSTLPFRSVRSTGIFSRGGLWLVLLALGTAACAPASFGDATRRPDAPPNLVIVFADDLGYADIGSFGAKGYQTPQLDRLAREGVRLTNFYVAQPVCSASRAALLTGCYANRVGILGALGPNANIGLNPQELTLAELLKQRGYATAIFGKWHLGHLPEFLPTRHGFDEYFGIPYSNDMWPRHPVNPKAYPPLPLIEQEQVIERDPDQTRFTTEFTQRAVRFIEQNKDRPFFLYLPHPMPHVPLFVSDKFRGKTQRGLFGDVIEELDWSVGQIMATLEKHDLDRNTLVIFTSDNGPWQQYGRHAGSTGPLREGKGTTFEGGVRVPFVAWWPGKIPAGTVSDEPAMTIDVYPTVAKQLGARVPSDRKLDGEDIWPLLSGKPGAKSPHEALYFYWGGELQAVRSGNWKLHFPHAYRQWNNRPGRDDGNPEPYTNGKLELSLFDLSTDVGEATNVADRHPDVVRRLTALGQRMREELGDTGTNTKATTAREPGRVNRNQ